MCTRVPPFRLPPVGFTDVIVGRAGLSTGTAATRTTSSAERVRGMLPCTYSRLFARGRSTAELMALVPDPIQSNPPSLIQSIPAYVTNNTGVATAPLLPEVLVPVINFAPLKIRTSMGGLRSAFDEPVRHLGYIPRPPRAQHGCVLTLRCRVTWALRRDELRLREAPGCA